LECLSAALCGIKLPFIYCLVFGALISPTDPVAVLSVLKQANVSKSLETKVAGESLLMTGWRLLFLPLYCSLLLEKKWILELKILVAFTERSWWRNFIRRFAGLVTSG
jgi:CPA1 family monovalent cation:H+ antiporter